MKKFQILYLILSLFPAAFSAQKIGVVDTNYILSKLPQYKEAEQRLNSQITTWEGEIQQLQAEYEKKKAAFENEKVLLVGDQLKQREAEVNELDKRIKTTINQRFGIDGEINRSRSAFTKPFQDQIWGAIRTMSEKNGLGIVLDKSNNISVIFLEKRYDYTDKVLDLLLKNQSSANPGTAPTNRGNNNSGSNNRALQDAKIKRANDAASDAQKRRN